MGSSSGGCSGLYMQFFNLHGNRVLQVRAPNSFILLCFACNSDLYMHM